MFAGALLSEGRWRLARALLAVNPLLLAGFSVSLGLDLGGRGDRIFTPWVDELLVALPALACLLRAVTVRRDRTAWLCATAALSCWVVGDVYYEAHVVGAGDPRAGVDFG